jgi:hypothetical protein
MSKDQVILLAAEFALFFPNYKTFKLIPAKSPRLLTFLVDNLSISFRDYQATLRHLINYGRDLTMLTLEVSTVNKKGLKRWKLVFKNIFPICPSITISSPAIISKSFAENYGHNEYTPKKIFLRGRPSLNQLVAHQQEARCSPHQLKLGLLITVIYL